MRNIDVLNIIEKQNKFQQEFNKLAKESTYVTPILDEKWTKLIKEYTEWLQQDIEDTSVPQPITFTPEKREAILKILDEMCLEDD